MIPLKLELVNFLAYRHPGPLSFEGIHVACLAGPNGAGKSSLLDAISWSLWGKARSNSADDLVHQGESEMSVTFEFAQGSERFRVLRQRSSGKRGASLLDLQIWEPESSGWRSLAGDTIRDTQAQIESILSLDYETFVNSAFLIQGRADEFTTKTPTQRKQILSDILGLDRWEAYEARAKEDARTVQGNIQLTETRLNEMEGELSKRRQYEEDLVQAESEAKEREKALQRAESEWSSLESSRRELVSLQRQLDDLSRSLEGRRHEIEQAEAELEETERQADSASIQATLETTGTELAKLRPLEAQVERLREQRSDLMEQAASLRGANEALIPETEPLKSRAETLGSAAEPLCPTCGQPLSEEHRHRLLDDLERQLAERRVLFSQNRERIHAIEAEVGGVEKELAGLQEELKQRPGMEKKVGELERALAHSKQARSAAEALKSKLARWQEQVKEEEERSAQLEAAAQNAETQLRQASLSEKELDEIRGQKRLADERVGGARQRLKALDDLEQQAKASASELERLKLDLSLLDELKEAFGKSGVPAMIIETAVPELERGANELLGRMTDGRLHVRIETQREIKTGALREALDIIISDELGSRSYELYSGGEAFRINFAIRIALSRLLANRAGAELRSLFIDEGFGTQDAQGREQLVQAINRVQDDFDRILVITHIEELKDSFPARIEVRKAEGGSQFSLS